MEEIPNANFLFLNTNRESFDNAANEIKQMDMINIFVFVKI
jgi:hypothetical protein